MKNKVNIINAGNHKYISEVMDDLPDNCILNKVLTGCGGTSLALKNGIPYVVCVPYINLVKNKLEWASKNGYNICGVNGKVSNDEIRSYIGIKYIVTYDSLNRLCQIIDPSKFKILIDESHKLVDSAIFRSQAVSNVLDLFTKFKSFCFMTSTPVKNEYQLPLLKKIPEYKISWNNTPEFDLTFTEQRGNLEKSIAVLALDFIEGRIAGNAHIFYNSVCSIVNVIKYLQQTQHFHFDQISINLANSVKNKDLVERCFKNEIKVTTPNQRVRKVNFYTSTAFEGCDIFDLEGHSYIVADGTKKSTKYDILTTVPQILGRIRNSNYKNSASIIYKPQMKSYNMTEEEYSSFIKEQLQDAVKLVEAYDFAVANNKKMIAESLLKGSEDNPFVTSNDKRLSVTENIWYNKMHEFSSQHSLYCIGDFENRCKNGGYRINDITYNCSKKYLDISDTAINKMRLGRRFSFRSLAIEYIELVKKYSEESSNVYVSYKNREYLNKMKKKYREICELVVLAYEKLGPDKMKALEYRKGKIEKELLLKDKLMSSRSKIVRLLDFQNFQEISNQDLKKKLQSVYDDLGIDRVAKAVDIHEYYETKKLLRSQKSDHFPGVMILNCKVK